MKHLYHPLQGVKKITVEQDKRTQDPDEEGLSYGHDVAVIYMNS